MRLKLTKNQQIDFFRKLKTTSGLGWDEIAETSKLSGRTLRDWARAKYTPHYIKLQNIARGFGVRLPEDAETLQPYWYVMKGVRKGALARYKLYGAPGNIETRRKGGLVSQEKRREDPEKYKLLGCIVRKEIKPLKPSVELAELVGILLGDGSITNDQIRVTLNKKTDKEYANFVSKLMSKIFREKPSSAIYGSVIDLTLSGLNYVLALEKVGLKRGNKVRHQVAIPEWILNNKNYSRVCLRGLMDTDGGVYFHHHITHGNQYINFGLTFSNHSLPLIQGAAQILKENNFSPSIVKNRKIYIYNLSEIKRYFKVIKSSNPKHTKRLNMYLKLNKK
jgi:hypothetical protein